jgi:hypothetical protein
MQGQFVHCSTSGSRLTSWDGLTSAPDCRERGQSLHQGGCIEKGYIGGQYRLALSIHGPTHGASTRLSKARSLGRSAAIRASRALIPLCGFDTILHGKVYAFSILQNWQFAEVSNFVFQEFVKFQNSVSKNLRKSKTIARRSSRDLRNRSNRKNIFSLTRLAAHHSFHTLRMPTFYDLRFMLYMDCPLPWRTSVKVVCVQFSTRDGWSPSEFLTAVRKTVSEFKTAPARAKRKVRGR